MATFTLKTVLEYLCDDFGLGRYGTASAGSATSITDDTRFGGPDGAKSLDAGCSVYITSDAGGASAAPEDEETRLSTKPKLPTGVATLDPALTAAVAASDGFMIAYKPFTFKPGSGPYAIIAHINQALATFQFEKRIVPITLAPDGDMLASGTTSWTAVDGAGGANTPTLAKVAASFPNGERALRVTNNATGAGDYARSGLIAVEENKSYYLETLAWGADSADAGTLVAYDQTGSAGITLSESAIDRIEPERLRNTVTTPAGCEQVSIRLTCTAVSDVINWAYVIFRKNEAQEFVLADRPQKVLWVGRLLIPSGKDWSTRGTWNEVPSKAEQLGAGLWRIKALESVANRSLWYEEFVAPAAMTTAAGTTTIDARDLAAITAERLLRPIRAWSRDWTLKYDFALSQAAGAIDRYVAQNKTVVNQMESRYPLLRV